MKEHITMLMKGALRGKNTHTHPNHILRGLTAKIARKHPTPTANSCWDELHHIVAWQHFCLEVAKGNTVPWKTIKANEWPSTESPSDDSQWQLLLATFKKGLQEGTKLVESIALWQPMPGWDQKPAIQALLVFAQHNSYHLGQIVAIRKALGAWPPLKAIK